MDRVAAYIACFVLGFTLAFWMNNRNAYLIMQDQIATLRAEVLALKIMDEQVKEGDNNGVDT